ncbi:transcription termination factor Rho [Rhodococcus coprophilus]|uniref:Transcription termination factor Rho n=1 Tax=Rhodococcus coprophilus TaxID=38310 RepID=A0A2X4UA47_9NOCA|nr:transcription termination factor Rho [Rhodococcus coprophilus]MBM7457401.1 transcription termination factor Rho [Rhodococcus coprophilus]SQI29670.1 transcription termination factor Rho [Rhodococcus coprophilus]
MTDTDLIATSAPDTTESAGGSAGDSAQSPVRAGRRGTGLSGMVLAELRTLAAELGIKGTSGMRKGDLIAAIKERQGAGSKPAPVAAQPATETPDEASARPARGRRTRTAQDAAAAPSAGNTQADDKPAQSAPAQSAPTDAAPLATESKQERTAETAGDSEGESDGPRRGRGRRGRRGGDQSEQSQHDGGASASEGTDRDSQERGEAHSREKSQDRSEGDGGNRRGDRNQGDRNQGDRNQGDRNQGDRNQGDRNQGDRNQGDRNQGDRNQGDRNQGDRNQGDRNQGDRNQGDRNQGDRNQGDGNNGPRHDNRGGDDEEGGRGRRGRRFRERRRGRERGEGGSGADREPEIREDDVLQPVAGILDVLDNYAFVRTSGYLAGPNDVYVSMNMVRKNGLRRGDAITGAVRVPREGEQAGSQRQKFNPLVRLDTVNGGDVEAAKRRPEFNKLTPLYPNERLRLETQQNILTTRVIDLVMPIGKGQRALIVSPPKAGKTTVLQDIANAISVNNPECYLMVVLVDERPEEVTDMQRSVKGEVISSTFDRPPSDHTSVAELAIERAKRLVEMGRDVVVLLDSITRLGRAYNNSSPASGRILSGGVDSTALYPPKRFLGAARNIENGGSLTIIATAMVETGSTGDTVIFEEFKGTGNAELKLDRKIAERRVFPAVDVNPSGTRKDELLMSPDEFAVVHKLRRVLSGLDSHQAIDVLIDRLKKSKTNIEFLMTVAKTAPGALED